MRAEATDIAEDAGRDLKLSDHVYERIFELIVNGEFAEHARLPAETELARRFNASRPVIRAALARLRDDGVIVSRQGSGSYVKRRPDNAVLRFVPVSSIADIQRCFEFRAGLEGAAAALAAERRDDDDLGNIKAALDELGDCIRTGRLGVEADERFHLAVAEATHNHFHVSVQRSLQPHIAFGMNLARNLSLLRPATRLEIVQDEHVAIVDAIERRDAPAARAAMETHIENARHRVFEGQARED
jgi:GntR family transcriptional regulator, transcriptional repressor for pyruvate dehydrogenase complex